MAYPQRRSKHNDPRRNRRTLSTRPHFMKQYLLQENDDGKLAAVLNETHTPDPGSGEVRVKMEACSLNYRDLLMKSGLSASSGEDAVIPLSDGAGVISAVGEGVSVWCEDDRVALTFFRDWESGP